MSDVVSHIDPSARARYVDSIIGHRRAKDTYLLTEADSPLRRPDIRHRLSYFPVDERYRLVVARPRRVASDERPIVLAMSDGATRIARRVAVLDLHLAGTPFVLTGFSLGSTPPGSLFVPFTDRTSGLETYGSGRYLDLQVAPDGSVEVDFNLAYHPYCAYSRAYSCPLAPSENRVPIAIPAGERLPIDEPA